MKHVELKTGTNKSAWQIVYNVAESVTNNDEI